MQSVNIAFSLSRNRRGGTSRCASYGGYSPRSKRKRFGLDRTIRAGQYRMQVMPPQGQKNLDSCRNVTRPFVLGDSVHGERGTREKTSCWFSPTCFSTADATRR